MTARARDVKGNRRGYALLAVLWVVATATVLGAALSLTANQSVDAAQNRVDLLRAQWRAEGCAERARAAVQTSLDAEALMTKESDTWRELDRVAARSPLLGGCDVSFEPSGTRLDVNSDSTNLIRRLLEGLGVESGRADSLIDALDDWRDADEVPRRSGAEREWYTSHHRAAPANAPLADIAELRRVRGFEAMGALDTLLGTEPDRILLARAPPLVLGALPGFGTEAVARILELRAAGGTIRDLAELPGLLSPPARSALLSHYAELVGLTTTSPDAWTLTSRTSAGARATTAVVRLRIVKAGGRVAIVRRTVWP
jgi:general secretion pathway protein K